jgi:hypothetical protein
VWILNHIDCFVSQRRRNPSVQVLHLHSHAFNGHNDEVWDELGQAVGNLQALEELQIFTPDSDVHETHSPNWEILGRLLSHIRQKVSVDVHGGDHLWAVEDVQAFARAIRGHPSITSVDTNRNNFPYESMESLYSELATLPALESVRISCREARLEVDPTGFHQESLTALLRVPFLRSVCFDSFSFTPALCHATANAFINGTAVTKLEFYKCRFPVGECAAILENGFSRNTSVSFIEVTSPFDEALNSALAAALLSNSTLQVLSFKVFPSTIDDSGVHVDWSPILLALEKNTGLKALSVDGIGSIDDSLCTAMQNGLGMNQTLERLYFKLVYLTDDNLALWCRAFSVLLTNKALKSLAVEVKDGATESTHSTFCLGIVAMLEDNASLENLDVQGHDIKAEEYFVLITALQHNMKLKTFTLKSHNRACRLLNVEESKLVASLLKKNYALESLPNVYYSKDVKAILRLNAAGRRYLIEDGSSVSKGVEVLSRVNDDINCAFLHLSENPRLCDRSAVEIVTTSESNGRSSNPTTSSGGGKREQTSACKDKESRRRLE